MPAGRTRAPGHNGGMWRRYAVAGWLAIALLAGCGSDRIEIAGSAARTSGHGPALTPATESAHTLTPDTAALLAVADDNGQPLTDEIRLRGGSIVAFVDATTGAVLLTVADTT
jgi:hypothetical protein